MTPSPTPTLTLSDIQELIKMARKGDLASLSFQGLTITLNPKEEKKSEEPSDPFSIFSRQNTSESLDEKLRLGVR